ncbi:MAG TPA: acetyl-CoA carboxylase biotin carboxyl carrier protein subunit [Clostridiales bacterium]|nr:acetyl-CoA carboxylase biotin carboxyl carrier protein subunit [Clostridiales bacterium]
MKYKVTLNGKTYEVEVVEDKAMLLAEYEAIAPQASPEVKAVAEAPAPSAPQNVKEASPASEASSDAVKAPIGGAVLSTIQEGSTVKSGDVVVIIEAMKMENEIVAPKAGTVTKIYVSKGSTVETGAPLFDIK